MPGRGAEHHRLGPPHLAQQALRRMRRDTSFASGVPTGNGQILITMHCCHWCLARSATN